MRHSEAEEPFARTADALFEAHPGGSSRILLAPALLDAECANGLVKAVRRGRPASVDAVEAMARVLTLPIERLVASPSSLAGLRLALRHGISAHDGVYVAVAAQEKAPLIAADRRLVWALRDTRHDVRLLADVAEA